jgi:hypothetical protein
MTFVAKLPPGYDERTRMALGANGRIVIAHPDLPALVLDEVTNTFVPLAF